MAQCSASPWASTFPGLRRWRHGSPQKQGKFRPCPCSAQKEIRALTCISRGGVITIVIVLNCGVFTYRLGVPRLTMLRTLNASPRNWKLALSVNRKVRPKTAVEKPTRQSTSRALRIPTHPQKFSSGDRWTGDHRRDRFDHQSEELPLRVAETVSRQATSSNNGKGLQGRPRRKARARNREGHGARYTESAPSLRSSQGWEP
jgi:hypothetical protein